MKNYFVLGISILAGILSFFFITNKIDAERKRLEGSSQRIKVLAFLFFGKMHSNPVTSWLIAVVRIEHV